MRTRNFLGAVTFLAAFTLAMVGCGSTETVVQTVIVEKEVAGQTVIETVIVTEKGDTVVVTEKGDTVVQTVVVTEKGDTVVVTEKGDTVIETVVVTEKGDTVVVEVPVETRNGGNLKVVAEASVASLDSIATGGGVNLTVAGHIYDQLFNLGEGLVVIPQMVDKWSVASDGLVWTMTLRDGLLFHDGDAVTSADVVASLNRIIDTNRGTFRQVADRLDAIETQGDKTVVIRLKEPYSLLLESLATMNLYPPIQKAEFASTTPANEPIEIHTGSGPFKLVSWDAGASIKMERFEEYVPRSDSADGQGGAKKVFIDTLEWIEVPDSGTRIVLLEAGEVDFVQTAPQDDFGRLKQNRDLQIFAHPFGRTPILIFNNINPPFDDVLARRAVAAAINAEEIMAAYGPRGLWRTCGVIWGCGTIYESSEGLENYNQGNIDKGRELLAQSGYDGSEIDVMVPIDQSTIAPITQIAAPRLEAIGLNINVVVTDWATVVQRRGQPTGYHIMGTWGTTGSLTGPATAFATPHYCNCGTDTQKALSDEFLLATTLEEKQRIAFEKQQLFYQEVPWMHLGEFFSYHIATKELKGYPAAKLGEPAFWNTWLERN